VKAIPSKTDKIKTINYDYSHQPKTWQALFTFLKSGEFPFSATVFQEAVRNAARSDPWYLQLFIFVSALMSASALLGLLANLGVFADQVLTALLGTILMFFSLLINVWCADRIAKRSGIVLSHVGIFLHLNAKVLLLIALTQWFANFLSMEAAFLSAFYLVEWVLLLLYRNVLTYFLSFPLLVGLTIAFGTDTWFLPSLPYLLLLLSVFAVSFFLWEWRLPYRYFHAYRPLALGAMLAVQFLLLWSWQLPAVFYPLPTSLLWLALTGLTVWLLADWYGVDVYRRFRLLFLALLWAAAFFAYPGIVSASLFILLAFHSGYRLLMLFSFLALFLHVLFWLLLLNWSSEGKLLLLFGMALLFFLLSWLVARRCCFR
jgi:hypothetical protein